MSLKVVIVEDNPITVRSLVKTIDWAALKCEVAGTAGDGESGGAMIRSAEAGYCADGYSYAGQKRTGHDFRRAGRRGDCRFVLSPATTSFSMPVRPSSWACSIICSSPSTMKK